MVDLENKEQEILEFYNNKEFDKCIEIIKKLRYADVGEILNYLDEKIAFNLYKKLEINKASEIFNYLSFDLKEYILTNLNQTKIKQLINDLYTDDIINAVENMPVEVVKRVFNAASKEQKKEIASILKYDIDTAGSIMSVNFLSVKQTTTVSKTIKEIQKNHDDYDEIDDVFVVNKLNQLVGSIEVKDLILNDMNTKIEDIMNTKVISINSTQSQEDASNALKKYDISTLAVVDNNNVLVGIITSDDIIDVLIEETNEDMQKYTGIRTNETNYFDTSFFKMFISRIWSLVLMLGLTIITNGLLLIIFQKYNWTPAIKTKEELLFMLIPLSIILSTVIICCANQTLVMIRRAISLEQINKKSLKTIVLKELVVSLMISFVLVIVNLLKTILIYAVKYNANLTNINIWNSILISSIGIFISIIFANLLSLFLPLIVRKIGKDSSSVSLPLLALIIDILCVGVFLGIGLLV
ncbi:magnesium transporter [Mycoplasma sp. 06067-C1-B144P-99-0482-3]|uniref:magnesium transporter n=1 Tax=Mycoplasma sp. 06067-C1-B144P-99-0482-3 TaxID=3117438 RepID=UPI003DA665A5